MSKHSVILYYLSLANLLFDQQPSNRNMLMTKIRTPQNQKNWCFFQHFFDFHRIIIIIISELQQQTKNRTQEVCRRGIKFNSRKNINEIALKQTNNTQKKS